MGLLKVFYYMPIKRFLLWVYKRFLLWALYKIHIKKILWCLLKG